MYDYIYDWNNFDNRDEKSWIKLYVTKGKYFTYLKETYCIEFLCKVSELSDTIQNEEELKKEISHLIQHKYWNKR